MGFREKLKKRQEEEKTLVCVGLDPIIEKIPGISVGKNNAYKVMNWMKDVVVQTSEFACMYKPNIAFWEALEPVGAGIEVLAELIEYIHEIFSDIPVFLDCKCGDIGNTQKRYAIKAFDLFGADGMNFSPYMGKDCMSALVDKEKWPGKALVGLCYTSNPDARQIQDLRVYDSGDKPLWEFVAGKTFSWAEELGVVEDAGLVMAAAYEEPPKGSGKIYSEHLRLCRAIVGKKLWFLIPGIGTQGGYVEETVRAAYCGPGSIAINSSSDIIFDEDPGKKARFLRDTINKAIPA